MEFLRSRKPDRRGLDWNDFRISISTFVNAIFFGLTLLQIAFGPIGITVSIGLLQLRESARKAAIFLSTVPVAALAMSLLLFLGATSEHGRGGIAAMYGAWLYGASLHLVVRRADARRSNVSISMELKVDWNFKTSLVPD